MKKSVAFILLAALAFSVILCGCSEAEVTETTEDTAETTAAVTTEMTEEYINTETSDTFSRMDDIIFNNEFTGIVYLTKDGRDIYSQVNGADEKGNLLSIESPMYVGSVSKQFCAASVMMLCEDGKLSLSDTLTKYYPEYTAGKDVTIQNLLSMRSGIPEMFDALDKAKKYTEEEAINRVKKWLFEQELNFEPDAKIEYVNSNYFLLSGIVEQVSGQSYEDFVRENIFEPLEMNDSHFVKEVKDAPDWAEGITYETFTFGETEGVIARGAGDVVTTAYDMEKWMSGLAGGKIISQESFLMMCADQSPNEAVHYGFGLEGFKYDGVGHVGNIGSYYALNYINTEKGYNMFMVSNCDCRDIMDVANELLDELME